jgi:hypothetical protein
VTLVGRIKQRRMYPQEICYLYLKKSRHLQMPFATLTRLFEGLSLDTLLTLKVEKSSICSVATRRPTVSITEQKSLGSRRR